VNTIAALHKKFADRRRYLGSDGGLADWKQYCVCIYGFRQGFGLDFCHLNLDKGLRFSLFLAATRDGRA
jgi:hypothetical protein